MIFSQTYGSPTRLATLIATGPIACSLRSSSQHTLDTNPPAHQCLTATAPGVRQPRSTVVRRLRAAIQQG
ncbi:hypothetical protein [Stutzerimonas tarimensis]|uniref:Uncharacterized protein n=1 Tax=Stutzerimonas tarimensis TaxID=1507735 RepID=A0ABV7T2M9_9GAMM